MSAYVFLIIYIMIIWCITKKGTVFCTTGNLRGKKINVFMWLSFVAIFLLAAFRNEMVGVDTVSYIKYYKAVKELNWKGMFNGAWDHLFFTTEKGFMVFEKICGDLMIPTQLFIALCAGIFVYGIYKLIKNYANDSVLLAVFSFLAVGSYLLSLNVLRQGIGVGICYIAWIDLKKGNRKRFIIEVLIACSFHVSCCVFFLALLFEKIPANKKNIFISIVSLIGFGFVGATVISFVLRWFPVYAKRYGNGRWEINEANGIVVVWIIVIAVVIALALKEDWSIKENHGDFEIMLFSLCYVCINIIGLSFDGAQRLSMLFQPFLILLFDRSCSLWKGKIKSIYMVAAIVGMIMIFIKASSTAQYAYLPFWA